MTTAEFTAAMYEDACWSYGPQPMTLDDATYNLREYRADRIPVPRKLTAKRFCDLWNLLYTRDTMEDDLQCAIG